MDATVTLDSGGRVLLPKALRDELQLTAGDSLQLRFEGDEVVLRPVRSFSRMRKERGMWVFRAGKRVTTEEINGVLGKIRGRNSSEQ